MNMYVPPLHPMLRSLGMDKDGFERAEAVTVPASLFRFLVGIALATADFNEEGYLSDNPDVADGVRSGTVPDASEHYLDYGYFEGRTGATPDVSERWYLATYPDVAAAVQDGTVRSAKHHFDAVGSSEGRAPNAAYADAAAQWKAALEGRTGPS